MTRARRLRPNRACRPIKRAAVAAPARKAKRRAVWLELPEEPAEGAIAKEVVSTEGCDGGQSKVQECLCC